MIGGEVNNVTVTVFYQNKVIHYLFGKWDEVYFISDPDGEHVCSENLKYCNSEGSTLSGYNFANSLT